MKKWYTFLLYCLLNSGFLYLATLALPGNYVLGTYRYTTIVAALISGIALTAIVWLIKPFAAKLGIKNLSGRWKMFAFYFLANSLGIWIVARLSPLTGFGISGFYYALILGFAINLAQWVVWQGCKATKLAPWGK